MLSELLIQHQIEYHSWNAGPRSCIGRALATYEGITISTAILQRFDVILSDDSKTYEPLAAMNMVRCLFTSTNIREITNYILLSRE